MDTQQRPLGEFEQTVLLSILRVGNRSYGVEIRQTLLAQIHRDVAIGALYTTLARLEDKGLVTSQMGEATAQRGGRAKKYYSVTAQGQSALKASLRNLRTLAEGLDMLRGAPGHG
ncbi:PadR family transcriptional regulator [Aestuariibacter halophilus]|uniref:PadR family transcriptional regulator n=1 Tax=Fluctibacter halophilus TaxID=226011 RepID=A0ABS8GBN5_9ALTE|nr:helix-turn-helix transcriptional regulator [Aestuariibacter halophilus]MCC2617995.1 PadR family transcriptional regulator [Aestuariibacter halophilus]